MISNNELLDGMPEKTTSLRKTAAISDLVNRILFMAKLILSLILLLSTMMKKRYQSIFNHPYLYNSSFDIVIHVHQILNGICIISDVSISMNGVFQGTGSHREIQHVHWPVVM